MTNFKLVCDTWPFGLNWGLLCRNKSHNTAIKEKEQDKPDWLSQGKWCQVLSPFGGTGKVTGTAKWPKDSK